MKAWWIRRKLSEWIITSSNIHYEVKCLRLRSYFLPPKSCTCFQFLGQPSDDIGRFIVSIVEFLAILPPLRPPDSPPYANFYPCSLWSHFINSACCTPRVQCHWHCLTPYPTPIISIVFIAYFPEINCTHLLIGNPTDPRARRSALLLHCCCSIDYVTLFSLGYAELGEIIKGGNRI